MFLGSEVRLVCRDDNLTAIFELIVYTLWDPQQLTAQQASMVCYGDSFTLLFLSFSIWSVNICYNYPT
jgi:hypothetical protein